MLKLQDVDCMHRQYGVNLHADFFILKRVIIGLFEAVQLKLNSPWLLSEDSNICE